MREGQFIECIQYWYEYGPEPRKWWRPQYNIEIESGRGQKTISVEADDVESAECPKSISLRMPEVVELIQIVGQSSRVDGALGDPSKWPGAFYDAVTYLKIQEDIDSGAQSKAIRNQ